MLSRSCAVLSACLLWSVAVPATLGEVVQPDEKPAAGPKDDGSPRPVLVLMEHNPWLMVIGSDAPSFALYDDGTAIFVRRAGDAKAVLQSVRLERDELDDFLKSLPLEELSDLQDSPYRASSATDQPTTVIHAWREGKHAAVAVYGDVRGGVERAKREAEKKRLPEDEMLLVDMKSVPGPFAKAVERLIGFEHPRAKPWLPREVEVMIWPYAYAPDESLPWPREWPGLKDPAMRRRGRGSYSLYLPASELEPLRKFLASRREKQAILIDGKKWAVSCRLPFPRESEWMSGGR